MAIINVYILKSICTCIYLCNYVHPSLTGRKPNKCKQSITLFCRDKCIFAKLLKRQRGKAVSVLILAEIIPHLQTPVITFGVTDTKRMHSYN